MEFGVLGSLFVLNNGVDVTPTAPKQRQMLALLIFNANRVVSIAQFVAELWGPAPPSSAVDAVHTYIMQLRRTLRGTSADTRRLITRERGYELVVRPGELDLDVFTDRVRLARTTLARGDHDAAGRLRCAAAAGQLRGALDLWRSSVLVDVFVGPILGPATATIEDDRITATAQRIEAELRLGRHNELVGELSGLVYCHPANEDLVAHLMVALYRSGRPADALAAYCRLRDVLAREHGTSPSDRLSRLHLNILTMDPTLEAPAPSIRSSLDLVSVPVPRNGHATDRGRARI
jgi:SARP family transcriptional regulator, regulator of embCAB operon